MGTITVQTIVDDVADQLNDTDHTRWTEATLVSYFNSAQRSCVVQTLANKVTPAYVKTSTVSLTSGAKQTLPSDGLELRSILSNQGRNWVTGNVYEIDNAVIYSSTRYVCVADHTAGTFSTDLAAGYWEATNLYLEDNYIERYSMANISELLPNWMSVDPSDYADVLYWVYSENDKKSYYVYPPQPRTEDTTNSYQNVLMEYVAIPVTQTISDTMILDDVYKEPIMAYMMYKAFLRDDEVINKDVTPRAVLHYQEFTTNTIFLI